MKFITVGSDPEFFVRDPKGRPYPATLFSVGSKDKPSPIPGLSGFYEQRDNLAFEGNIPPAKNKKEFIDNMTTLRNYFSDKVSRVGYSLSNNGVEYFIPRYLNTIEGMEFGCSSVTTLWNSIPGEIIDRPSPMLDAVKFRVAGFHLHIGYDHAIMGMSKEETDLIVGRLFDLFVTGPSHVIKYEPERLRTYGSYGMVRIKDYGIECRTLSSFFTQEKYLPWVWDQLMKVESFINKCDAQDLRHIYAKRHYVDGYSSIERTFADILRNFRNRKPIDLFDETIVLFRERENRSLSTIPSLIRLRDAAMRATV